MKEVYIYIYIYRDGIVRRCTRPRRKMYIPAVSIRDPKEGPR